MDKENEMQVAAKPKSQAERFRDQMDKQRDLIVKQMPKALTLTALSGPRSRR